MQVRSIDTKNKLYSNLDKLQLEEDAGHKRPRNTRIDKGRSSLRSTMDGPSLLMIELTSINDQSTAHPA